MSNAPIRRALASATLAGSLALSGVAVAEEHIIEGVVTQWRPLVTFAQPGDTLRFKGMTGHDTETIEGMFPEGGTAWKSQLGEEGYSVTLDKEGTWVYKCNPHITTGMVGVVFVGDAEPDFDALNASAAKVKVGGNMVKRALRKAKKALESK